MHKSRSIADVFSVLNIGGRKKFGKTEITRFFEVPLNDF